MNRTDIRTKRKMIANYPQNIKKNRVINDYMEQCPRFMPESMKSIDICIAAVKNNGNTLLFQQNDTHGTHSM